MARSRLLNNNTRIAGTYARLDEVFIKNKQFLIQNFKNKKFLNRSTDGLICKHLPIADTSQPTQSEKLLRAEI